MGPHNPKVEGSNPPATAIWKRSSGLVCMPGPTAGGSIPSLHQQRLRGLADEPDRVEHLGMRESDPVVREMSPALQVNPFADRRAQEGRSHGWRNREPLFHQQ